MSIRFVIGRSGSGKTARCAGRIAEACRAEPLGRPILWIVPKQATFQAERQLVCTTGLRGFCRARVLSFDQLARDVQAECGGVAIPEISPLGRQMILGHLLRKHRPQLHYFSSVAGQTGLPGRLDATLAELERSGKTATDLTALLAELERNPGDDVQTQSLRLKLHDLQLIAHAYEQFLGQERLDPHRRLQQVLNSITGCASLRGCTVYVDGFFEFADEERRTLAALARVAAEMEITLTADPDSPTLADPHHLPDEMDLFHQTLQAYRRLYFCFSEDGIEVEPPILLRQVHRFQSAGLSRVESHWMQSPPVDPPAADGLELIRTPNRRAEAEAAADRIRELVKEGMRYRDIAVLCRDLNPYHQLLDAAFVEREIPCFVDHRRGTSHHPLLEMLRSILSIARHSWPQDALLVLLKTGLVRGIDLDAADRLENYVLQHRIRGPAWIEAEPWTFQKSTRDDQTDEPKPDPQNADADTLRKRLTDPLRSWLDGPLRNGEHPLRSFVICLFQTLSGYAVSDTLQEWMKQAESAGDYEQRDEHEQTWNELTELLDLMVDLLGDEPLSLADFAEILESGLEQFDLALTPPTVDQVLVGQLDRTRLHDVQAVLVLGLCEGTFPQRCSEDLILCDQERRELKHWRLEIDPDSRRRLLDENLLAYRAFTRPSRRLIVFRPEADDAGRTLPASIFWDALSQLCPQPSDTAISSDSDGLSAIGTPRRLVSRLMCWAREQADPSQAVSADHEAMSALYHWLAMYPCRDDALAAVRFGAWKALSYRNNSRLSAGSAQQLFGLPLETSAAQLETFAACPFKHYLYYGLSLQARGGDELTFGDQGWTYHQILGRFVGQMLKNNTDWIRMKPDRRQQTIIRIAQAVGLTLKGQILLSSSRNQYLLDRIGRIAAQVVAAQAAALEHGRFAPAHTQVRYGGDGPLPALKLTTSAGQQVHLNGVIDRIDLIDKESSAVVYDYKLSGGPFSLQDFYHGLSLHLPAALLAIRDGGEALAGRELGPVGAFYVQLRRKFKDVDHPDEAMPPTDPAFHLQIKPRGIFDQSCAESLDRNLADGESDVIQCRRNQNGQFSKTSDVVTSEQFVALLDYAAKIMAQLAQRLLVGEVDIQPYLLNDRTACSTCEFKSVCRFDRETNRYNLLEPLKRDEALNQIRSGGGSK